jgi:hypothetical protein
MIAWLWRAGCAGAGVLGLVAEGDGTGVGVASSIWTVCVGLAAGGRGVKVGASVCVAVAKLSAG